MRLQRCAAGLGLLLLAGLTVFVLLHLSRSAQAAYATRLQAAAAPAGPAPPATAAWRQTLFLDRGTVPAAWLADGWSAPEPGAGVWSSGHLAVLRLPALPSEAPADVALVLEPYVSKGRPFQRVTIRAGARTLGQWRLTQGGPTTLHFQLPADLHGSDLQLDLPDADSPKRVENAMDVRVLAIKLRKVVVTG